MSIIGLLPTHSLAEAGQKVFAYHFRDFLKQEAKICTSNDIEFVHDMRVTTRRMRATIRVFESGFAPNELKFLNKALKEIAKVLGVIRDLDVFIEKLTVYKQDISPEEQEELTLLFEYCHLLRNRARVKMLAHLKSDAYAKFKIKVVNFIEKEIPEIKFVSVGKPVPYQICHLASALIYGRYEVIRAYEPFLNDAPLELLHQLRIDFKHFRYTLENFQEILGNESSIVLSEVRQIQDHLGDLNDAKVACQFLENFLENWKKFCKKRSTISTKKPMAVIRYLSIKKTEQEFLLANFPNAWNQFNSIQLRHHLASAVAGL